VEVVMSQELPKPEVVRRYVDEMFHRTAAVLSLRWPGSAAHGERLWELPDGVNIVGAPPQRFGFHLQRAGGDAFSLRLLWNGTCLSWPSLSRMQLLSSALAPLLAALGTDLWYLLDQPARGENHVMSRAA
jgi:hypothetical protein